jgi:hypothetical protein
MSVVAVRKQFEGRARPDPTKTYAITYRVEVDSPHDGARTVLGAAGIPDIGEPLLSFGSKALGDAGRCVSVNASRWIGSPLAWKIEAIFQKLTLEV